MPDSEISKVDSSGGGDDKPGGGVGGSHEKDGGKRRRKKLLLQQKSGNFLNGCRKFFTKTNEGVQFPPSAKPKRHLPRSSSSNTDKPLSATYSPPPTSGAPICFPGKKIVGRCVCFKQPTVESGITDPNDPNFTSDMLKILIERNDFYSKECNPHLDTLHSSSSSSPSPKHELNHV